MEYVLNWLILLATFGAILVVAFVCSADLMRKAAPVSVVLGDVPSAPVAAQVVEPQPTEASVTLNYFNDGQLLHTQVIGGSEPGYIGALTCDRLGDGVPLRYVRIYRQDGTFCFSNADWQAPLSVTAEDGSRVDAPMGQVMPLVDGTQLHLMNGWLVECRLEKEGEQ